MKAKPSGEVARARSYIPFVATLAIGLIMTLSMTAFLVHRGRRTDQVRFDAAAHFMQERLDDRVEKYEQSLMMIREFFVDHPEASQIQWRQFMERLKLGVNCPALIEMGYAPLRTQDGREAPTPAWLASVSVSDTMATNFHHAGLSMPVLYLTTSVQQTLWPTGADLNTPEYGAKIRNARDRNALALTRKTRLDSPVSTEPRFGIRMFQPVYDANLPVEEAKTGENLHANYVRPIRARIQHFRGVVFGSLDMDLLLEDVLEDAVLEVAFEVFDGPDPLKANRVNNRVAVPRPEDRGRRPDLTNRLHTWRMYGDRWTLAFYPTERFDLESPSRNLWIVVFAGVAATVCVAGMVWIQLQSRFAAEAYSRQLSEARDLIGVLSHQREQIHRDLHDGVLQSLYSLALGLQKTRKALRRDPEEAEESCCRNLDALELAMGELRRHLAQGPAQKSAQLDLVTAIQNTCDSMNRNGRVPVEFRLDPRLELRPGPQVALHLVHIAREAIANAQRHSGAARICLQLSAVPGGLEMTIQDDGSGFDPNRSPGPGYGLRNMADRAREIGAQHQLVTGPGKGTRVKVSWEAAQSTVPAPEGKESMRE